MSTPRIPVFINLETTEVTMEFLTSVSFDSVVLSAITCLVLREVFLIALPDRIAGPGGWLIDSGEN